MLSESHPIIRRILRFCALPYCFLKLVNWKECTASRFQVIKDLLFIFFKLKYYPDNYGPCRLWEKNRNEWEYYYGSSYNAYARHRLRKEVQPVEYQILFNDKLICEQLCKAIDVIIPKIYALISPSDNIQQKITNILEITKANKLIIKPILGHAGRGILLAIKNKSGIILQDGTNQIELKNYVISDKYIIQEVVEQNDNISKISPFSVNTIRIVTLLTKLNEVLIISSSMRFGTGDAYVDNWSAGGVAVGIDHNKGILKEIAYDKFGKQYTEHPVSKIKFNNYKIPQWNQVIQIAKKVQKTFSFYKLIGMDIALSTDGPVLIEVNANSDIIFQEQTAGPLFKDKRVLYEFAKYDLLINKYQKNLVEK